MAELDLVPMEMCASINGPVTLTVEGSRGESYTLRGLFSERHYPSCTCPAYEFGKHTIRWREEMKPPVCKHIRRAQDTVCGWHEQYSAEKQEEHGKCPRCGGSTVTVLVGV